MTLARRTGSQGGPLVFVGAVAAALLIGIAAVSVAQADDGTGLTVEVIGSSASPTPTSTSTSTSTTAPTSETTVGGVGATDPGTAGGTTQPSPTVTSSPGSSVAGVLYVSGLSWSYLPSLNPLDGSLNLRFTVRNVYSETLSPTANLWINQIFGGPVGIPVTSLLGNVKAGETRTVEATFDGLAQWTMLSAHATLALPNTGDEVVAPISRDAIIWFLPWFVVLLAAAAAGWVLWRRLRPRHKTVAGLGEAPVALRQAQGSGES